MQALDNDTLQALVQSICSTGAWEPKAFAKKECIKVLAQLPQPSCPVADVVVQQYLGKILAHLKKQLQDTDSLVRDAACEALAAYAWALADAAGSSLPGNSSCPVVKLIFECLAEQKKEAQHGASQALLMVAPCIGPLDKELVKLILRMLKSATFQGTAPLLAAIASTDADTHAPVGLLKAGASAFLPYLNHLVGQPSSRRSSSGYDAASSQAASSGSGIIGCLAAKDWAVRRAAADALRAAVLLLGPAMEPDGRWQLGDPSSLTHRCLSALDAQSCKFDKVREARDAAREAAGLLQELQRFVQDEGPDGDWRAWVSSHVAYTGCVTPTSSSAQHSPLRSNTSDLETRMSLNMLRTSPICERFQQAAVQQDLIAEPGSNRGSAAGTAAQERPASASSSAAGSYDAAAEVVADEAEAAAAAAGFEVTLHLPVEEQQQAEAEQPQKLQQQPLRWQWSRNSSSSSRPASSGAQVTSSRPANNGGAATSSRPSSAAAVSRPGSSANSRLSTAEQQPALKRQSSHSVTPASTAAAAGLLPAVVQAADGAGDAGQGAAAAAEPTAVQVLPRVASGVQHQLSKSSSSRAASAAAAGTLSAWTGPTQQEWEQVQQLLQQYQQQHTAMSSAMQQMQEAHSAAMAGLQERVAQLEALTQQLVSSSSSGAACDNKCSSSPVVFPTAPQGPGSPSRLGPSRSASNAAAAAAAAAVAVAAADNPETPGTAAAAGATAAAASGGRASGRWATDPGMQDGYAPMFRSEDWGTPGSNSISAGGVSGSVGGSGMRCKPGLSVLDTLSAGHRSCSGTNTPTSAGGNRGWESQMATPSDLDTAYADALRGDKGDVHLLRLIQKTGPVWSKLAPHTSKGLLAVFIKHVKDGVMLHRVLPWLWRLADEDEGRPDLPEELQQQLLEALHCCPVAEDPQTSEKVALLESSLRTVWQHSKQQ
uniref:TOG domain-containing protein n=1 Tax=Tetradesmus obliquus TaxID=3088 RepID=A0A383W6D0_TETOB|eukprot:jgi/Sobl393_1/19000/SZX72574.1